MNRSDYDNYMTRIGMKQAGFVPMSSIDFTQSKSEQNSNVGEDLKDDLPF